MAALLAALVGSCSSAPSAAFAVSDLSIEGAATGVAAGDEVVVTARVRNTGDAAGTYEADLTVDGSIEAQDDVDLSPGQSADLRFVLTAGAPGDHEVRLEAAVVTLRVTDVARAAFHVSGLAVEPAGAEIQPGDEVVITASVKNTGDVAGTFAGELTIDGAVATQQDLDLAAGATEELSFPLVAGEPGDYAVRLGDATVTLRVLGPAAFETTSLVVEPNPAETGARLKILVGVANEGGLTGTHAVRLSIDGKAAGTKEATLAGGERTTLTFSVKAPGAGNHTIAAGGIETRLVVWRIERPANGKVLINKLGGGMGRLKITNGGDRDGVVILAKTSAPKKSLLAVYVRAGKSTTIRGIRDGTYVVYFTLGRRWDAYSRRFTADQEKRRFIDPIRFKTTRISGGTRYTIWTISLEAVPGGNAPTDPIGDPDFPGVP
ncbi:MAG: CARDB domain-containing protein [Chloroflexota bacterium]